MPTQELLTLLEEAAVINKKYQHSNNEFNLLTVSGAARREVQMCRIIGELLKPNGCHNMGTAFLKSFFSDVLKMKANDESYDAAELATTDVILEYGIDDLRRIDIVIKTSERRVPIEVKIEAGDQEEQCADYLRHAENSPLYYLTIDGHLPSEYSISAKELANVKVISWKEDIYSWIESSLKHTTDTSLIFVLTQILDAIDCISGATEDKMINEFADKALNTPERLASAVAIEKSLVQLKTDFINDVFHLIEAAVDTNIGVPKLLNKHDYTAKVNDYYKKGANNYPGISYPIKNDFEKNRHLWLRIELKEQIYVGLVIADEKDNPVDWKACKDNPLIKKISRLLNGQQSYWWLCWKYSEDGINYRSCNDKYIEAFDKNMKCKPNIINGYVGQITTLWNEAKAIVDSCESI